MDDKKELIRCIEENYIPRHHHDVCGKISKYSPLRDMVLNFFCDCKMTQGEMGFAKALAIGDNKWKGFMPHHYNVEKFKEMIGDILKDDCWTKQDLIDIIKLLAEKNKGILKTL